MSRTLQMLAVPAALLCVGLYSPTLHANPNDISLRGVGRPLDGGNLKDPAVLRYRRLSNELAIALAPRALAPAETLGMSGFEFSLVSTHTPINYQADYWQGQPGTPVFEGVSATHNVPKTFWTPSLHLRKGLPLSSEISITGSYLAFSEMFMLGSDFKIALHESYIPWLPAVAVRAAVSRLFGASDLDIISGEWDLMASLPFGLGGMAQVTPYIGYGRLYVHINSQVIDETPFLVTDAADQKGGDSGSLYNFPTIEWDKNAHARYFFGVRFISTFVELLYEFNLTQAKPKDVISHSFKLGFDV